MTAIPDALRQTGISYRQLDYWVRQGWLRPEYPHAGSGTRREWTNDELDVAVRMAKLVKAGLAHDIAANVARKGSEAWLSPNVKVVILP